MTVETDTRTMKVGDRVDLTASGLTHNPGTVMQVEAVTVRVVWDGNVGTGSVEDADRAATRYMIRELRMLTDEEMAEHPVPIKVAEHLGHTDGYDKASHQVPPGSIVVMQAEWEQRGTDIQTLRDRLTGADREFERFKVQVVEAAVEATNDHGWCSEVREIIEGLGLDWPSQKVTFTVHLDVEMSATRRGGDGTEPTESFIKSSLSIGDGSAIDLDDDWEGVSIDDVTVSSVSGVDTVTE